MKIILYFCYKHIRFLVISSSAFCENHVPSEMNVGGSSAV